MTMELAQSKSGHDKGKVYVVWKREESFAFLVDGSYRTTQNPKKKNLRHIQVIQHFPKEVRELLQLEPLTDEVIKRALKCYRRAIGI